MFDCRKQCPCSAKMVNVDLWFHVIFIGWIDDRDRSAFSNTVKCCQFEIKLHFDWLNLWIYKENIFFERSTVSSLDHQVFCIGHLVDLGHFIQINVVSFLNCILIDHIRIELILLKTMMAQNAHLFHEAPHLVVGSNLGILEYFSQTSRKPQCIPDICHKHHERRSCTFFLAGVNFYRFNAKNWHFDRFYVKKWLFFYRFNAKNWRFSV